MQACWSVSFSCKGYSFSFSLNTRTVWDIPLYVLWIRSPSYAVRISITIENMSIIFFNKFLCRLFLPKWSQVSYLQPLPTPDAPAAPATAAVCLLTAGHAAEWNPLHAERRSGRVLWWTVVLISFLSLCFCMLALNMKIIYNTFFKFKNL